MKSLRRLVGLAVALAAGLTACGTDVAGLDDQDADLGPAPAREDAAVPSDLPVTPPPADARAIDSHPVADAAAPAPDMRPAAVDAAVDRGACAFGRIPATRPKPDVILVFDRSSAMSKMFTGAMQTRWLDMTAAIDQSVMDTDQGVEWGLKLFPTTTGCDVAAGADVGVAPSNYSAVINEIKTSKPVTGPEGSPLEQGIRSAASALRSSPSTSPKYLIVATAGTPNCPAGAAGVMQAILTVGQVASQGIRTFVLGIASPGTPQHQTLNDLAVAGLEANSGDFRYYPVQNKQQMSGALDDITQRLESCLFVVNVPPPAPDNVALEVDGQRIPRDPNQIEGWNWGGNFQTVHVYGNACQTLRGKPMAAATLVYGCRGVSP